MQGHRAVGQRPENLGSICLGPLLGVAAREGFQQLPANVTSQVCSGAAVPLRGQEE